MEMKNAAAATLNQEGFLDALSVDFGRALKDLAIIFADLKRLAVLGNLPISLEGPHTLRVRFPGVDVETAERLCEDVGLQRGVVGQDADFDTRGDVAMALQFPYAPDTEVVDKTITSSGGSLRSVSEYKDGFVDDGFIDADIAENPWLTDLEVGYYSTSASPTPDSGTHCSQEFEGVEGIYRFIEECDRAQNRF